MLSADIRAVCSLGEEKYEEKYEGQSIDYRLRGVDIEVSAQVEHAPGLKEHVITIIGAVWQQLLAVEIMFSRMDNPMLPSDIVHNDLVCQESSTAESSEGVDTSLQVQLL